MTEKLESNPDAQKHFDVLFTKVGELIQGMGKKRGELQISDWEKIMKQLDKKILKSENIRTVEELKKFIQGKDAFPDDKLQVMAEGFLSNHIYDTEAGELIYQLSPNDAVKILIKVSDSANPLETIKLTKFIAMNFDYLQGGKDVNIVLYNLARNNSASVFYEFKKFRQTTDYFKLLKYVVSKMGIYENISFINSLGLSKTEKAEIMVIVNSVLERKKLLRDIMGTAQTNDIESLLDEEALNTIGTIQSEWVAPHLLKYIPKIDQKVISRWKSMIARNLFFQKKDITQENVASEIERIIKMRKEIGNTPLFQGKNILFAANIQKDESGENNFGKNTVLESLKRQGGKVDFQRPENAEKDALLQKKADVLDKFANTPPPFVFIFDGHGLHDGIYFLGGQGPSVRGDDELQVGISVGELINVYKKRLENFPVLKKAGISERDCLIFNSCFGHDFLRNFYAGLPDDISKPITISAAEFGQKAELKYDNDYENDFFKKTLDLGNPNGITTFENVFQGDEKEEASNPSLYIPDDKNQPMHLSQTGNSEVINIV